MSRLMLALKQEPRQPADLSPLTPERLAGLDRDRIAALELDCGNDRLPVGDLFDLTGEDASDLVLLNAGAKLQRIGAGMSRGRITVEGDAGAYAGLGMKGGEIEISGDAGAYAASAMRGGSLHVRGNAGDFLAAALPGESRGMAGGDVIVGGNAGDRVGERMRRGTVLIEGSAGSYCACRMIAGTIAVAGELGANPGYGMSRGTLLLRRMPSLLLPTFNDCGEHELGFLRLMLRAWTTLPSAFAYLPVHADRVRRFVGDIANGGQGEILVMLAAGA